ncbi:MAG: single-stranded DNA-binding protein [Pseudomonadota bacterium]
MASLNKILIMGNLGQDPEIRYLSDGKAVASFSVAANETWINKEGKKEEHTEWFKIKVWGKQGENCAEYLSKGRPVFIEGKVRTNQWDDKDGNKRYTTEIIASTVQFLGSQTSDNFQSKNNNSFASNQGNEPTDTKNLGLNPDPDSDIPF